MRFRWFDRRLLAATLLLPALGCPPRAEQGHETTPPATTSQLSADESGPKVAAALQRGDYAEAVALTERTALSRPEIDQAVGLLILDSLVDAQATTHPAGNVEDGVQRVEAAALAGHTDAATSLRALFHTGLSNQGSNVQLAPQPDLEACWRQVEDGAAAATHCVEMRRGGAPL
jgi:hypothetical protein